MEAKPAHDQSQHVADLYTAALAAACSIPLARNSSRDAKKQVRPALFAGHGCTASLEAAGESLFQQSSAGLGFSKFAVQDLQPKS